MLKSRISFLPCVLVFALAGACSDDPTTPADDSTDAGPDASSGESGKGGGGSGGSSTGKTGGTGGATGGTGGTTGGTGGSTGGTGGTTGGTGGSTGGRCGDVTCDENATCDTSGNEPTCVCAFGYDDVSGFGTKCELHDPPLCMKDADCESDHCVDGVCCASACDAPPVCHTADGATCEDGETCVYPEEADDTECDDGDLCTDDDVCTDGTCAGDEAVCDDDNVCTDDSCDPDADDIDSRCVFDGTGITTTGCAADTLCAMGFACLGNKRGDCVPATEVDCTGSDDQCNVGECDPTDGSCTQVPVIDGTSCNDGNACTGGEACHDGMCGMGTALTCDDLNECTSNECDPVDGCSNLPNTDPCDDGNPCTVNDRCEGGGCFDTQPKDCSSVENQCNTSMCMPDGSCVAVPLTGIACNDGLPCTSMEKCNSSGVCVDSDSDSACGVGSTSCTGNPRTCSCGAGYYFDTGTRTCKADVCSPNPCSANASCDDGGGSAVCTCDSGYEDTNPSSDPVTGVTCTNIDDCVGNPCGSGRGSCIDGIGDYSCSCSGDYVSVDPGSGASCVCDLTGVFAVQITSDLSWPNVYDTDGTTVLISGGTATTRSWALRSQTYGADGKLESTTISCGGETPDLCGTGNNGVIGAEAYAQFLTSQLFGTVTTPGSLPTEMYSRTCLPAELNKTCFPPLDIPGPLAGAAFQTNETAVVFGINLTDPKGAWPGPGQVGTVASPGVNGAYWRDDDVNGARGVTSFAARPGGTPIDGAIPDPVFAYPSSSPTCASPYAYWPVPWGGNLFGSPCDEATLNLLCRIKEFHVASRVISALKGTFASCNRITGDVIGPNPDSPSDPGTDGEMRSNARVGGCRYRTGGVGSSTDAGCSSTIYNWVDAQAGTCTSNANCATGSTCVAGHCESQKVVNADFVIKRTTDTTCAQVRARSAGWWTTDTP